MATRQGNGRFGQTSRVFSGWILMNPRGLQRLVTQDGLIQRKASKDSLTLENLVGSRAG